MAEATMVRGGKKVTPDQQRKMGKLLREKREAHADGLSQGALAKSILKPDGTPYHYTYVGGIERGTQAPSQMFLRSAAEFLGVNPEDLLPEGVAMDDLSEGVIRAPRGSLNRGRRTRRQRGAVASVDEPDDNGNGHELGAVALTLKNGILTLITPEQEMTVKGTFAAEIVNGRLRLAF